MLTYLLYENHHGYALTEENFSLYGETLPITIKGAKGKGVLYLREVAFPILDGKTEISTSLLRQGTNPLTYVEGDERYGMDALERCGNIAYVKSMKTRELLLLFLSFAQNTASALQETERRLHTAEQQIAGYPLFRQ